MENNIKKIIESPAHHAYILFGYTNIDTKKLSQTHPLHTLSFEKAVGVDDVRELQNYLIQKDNSEKRVFFIKAPNITKQAQNALLKTIEEMQKGVYIFLSLPIGTTIIDTLLSRVFSIEYSKQSEEEHFFSTFINASRSEKLKIIDDIWNLGGDSRNSEILNFVKNFEEHIHRHIQKQPNDSKQKVCESVQALYNLQDALATGAINKTTLQLFAFV